MRTVLAPKHVAGLDADGALDHLAVTVARAFVASLPDSACCEAVRRQGPCVRLLSLPGAAPTHSHVVPGVLLDTAMYAAGA